MLDQPQDSGQHLPKPPGGEVERFSPEVAGRSEEECKAIMERNPTGSWVRYEDYEKLKMEKAQLDRYADTLNKDIDEMEAELLELRYETRHLR